MRLVAVVIAVVLAARVVAWGAAGPLAAARAGTATFEDLLAVAAAGAALALLAWVAAVLVVTALAALPGVLGDASMRIAGRIAPSAAGRLARLALGMSLTAGVISACTPALVGGSEQPSAVATADPLGEHDLPGVGRIGGVLLPDETSGTEATYQQPGPGTGATPTTGAAPATGADTATGGHHEQFPVEPVPTQPFSTEPAQQPSPAPDGGLAPEPSRERRPVEVVVKRGDTLWAIAARHLGASATDTDVAAEWPRWYIANRAVIGDDPDLIFPGTILRPPTHR